MTSYKKTDRDYHMEKLKVFQLKDLVSQYTKNEPNDKIKKWRSARKPELVKIIITNKIDLKGYKILQVNPKPAKRYPKNVLGKMGKQYNEVQQKSYLVEFTSDPRYKNPLEAKQKYLTRDGNMEYKNLQDHQLKFIKQFIFSNLRGAVTFHGVGSGKTLSAVVCAYYYLKLHPSNNVIIISPSALLLNFVGEMIQYGLDPKDNRYKYFTFDKFARSQVTAENSLLIIDEAHNFRTAMIMEDIVDETGVVIGVQPKTNRKGYKILMRGAMKSHKVIALTGTAFVNGIYDVENLLAMVDGRDPCERKQFQEMLMHSAQRNDYFNWRISYYDRSPSSQFFPERRDTYIPLVMDDEFYEKYHSIEKAGKSPEGYADEHYQDKEVNDLSAFYNGVLNASNSIDGVDNPKIKYIINTIKAKPTEKFIVYSALMDAGVNILKESLREANIKAVYITGEQTIANKENAKKYFNGYDFKNSNFFNKSQIDDKNLKYINSDYRVLIITKAGAEGVDTVNCNNIILLDGQWNNSFTEQIVARAIRFKSHFGLPVPQRFVNVIRPLLIKPGDKIIFEDMVEIDKLKSKKEINSAWVELKKSIDVQKQIDNAHAKATKVISEVAIQEYIKKNPNVKYQGWNKAHFTPAEIRKKVVEILSRDVEKNRNEYDEIKSGKTPAIDLYLIILAKSKQAVIDSFIEFFGNKISLFETYQQSIIPLVQAKIEAVHRKLTDEEEAEIYSKLLQDEKDQVFKKPATELHIIKRDISAQNQQYFTPLALAEFVIEQSSLKKNKGLNIRILEPTAGAGDLIKPVMKFKNDVRLDLIEFDSVQLKQLKELEKVAPNIINILETNNFLQFIPSTRYDYIFTNPPFHLKRSEFSWLYTRDIWDTDFIMRAYGCLAVGGELVAIISNKWKSQPAFKQWLLDKPHKIIPRKNEKFTSSDGKDIKIDVTILKMTKKDSDDDDDLLEIQFFVKSKKEKKLADELKNNEITINDLDIQMHL